MMRWGKKKASFPSSHSSLITHVFPSSWLSKFKQKKKCSDHRSAKAQTKGQIELPSRIPSPGIGLKDGRFYSGDDDFYWRLSFGEEGAEKMVGSAVGQNSVSRDLHDDNPIPVPISYCRCSSSEDTRMDERSRSKNLAPGQRQTRIKQRKAGLRFPLENYAMRREKEKEGAESKKVRRKVQNFKKLCSRPSEEKHAKRVHHKGEDTTSKAAEKVVFEVQPETVIRTREGFCQSRASNSWKQQSFSFPHSKLKPIDEESECTLEAKRIEETYVEEEKNDPTLPWEKLEDIKVTETSPRNKQQRRSVYIKRNCQKKRRKLTCRIKSHSPRTAAKIECKIKALEDMKKARTTKMKMNERANADIPKKSAVKNTTKEKALTGTTYFDSFAVIKSSFNPRKDFRDSMMEMIIEEEIERPEELEELLASYLTLNYDEHHDLIVKVFREVWSELNELYFASKSQNDHYSNDR